MLFDTKGNEEEGSKDLKSSEQRWLISMLFFEEVELSDLPLVGGDVILG